MKNVSDDMRTSVRSAATALVIPDPDGMSDFIAQRTKNGHLYISLRDVMLDPEEVQVLRCWLNTHFPATEIGH